MVRLCTAPRPLLGRARKAGGEGRVAWGAGGRTGKPVCAGGMCAGSHPGCLVSAPPVPRSREGDSHFGHPTAGQALEAGTSLPANPRGLQLLYLCLAHREQLVP